MFRNRPIRAAAMVLAIGLTSVAAAACGGGGGAKSGTAPGSGTGAVGASATVTVASTGVGQVLVDSQHRTLYHFAADAGTRSACTGACATAWPPLLAKGTPTVGGAASAALVGTAKRSDGGRQVTYNGHPLYLFAQDTQAGQTTGQGLTAFGAPWYVLSPAGTQITTQPSNSGTNGGSGGLSGY
jgi:predicted lipoprotein with Yx(FWY)xxD motif